MANIQPERDFDYIIIGAGSAGCVLDERLSRDPRNRVLLVDGTCRMGRDARSVVDPKLRVWGVDGLRVVDCSVMPGVTGNTNAPAMALAWRAAEIILNGTMTSRKPSLMVSETA